MCCYIFMNTYNIAIDSRVSTILKFISFVRELAVCKDKNAVYTPLLFVGHLNDT